MREHLETYYAQAKKMEETYNVNTNTYNNFILSVIEKYKKEGVMLHQILDPNKSVDLVRRVEITIPYNRSGFTPYNGWIIKESEIDFGELEHLQYYFTSKLYQNEEEVRVVFDLYRSAKPKIKITDF